MTEYALSFSLIVAAVFMYNLKSSSIIDYSVSKALKKDLKC